MLWASDASGRIASISRESAVPSADARPDHTMVDAVHPAQIHPADVANLQRLLTSRDGRVSGRFRIRIGATERYVTVTFSGVSAVSPDDGAFTGYVGTAVVSRDAESAGTGGGVIAGAPTEDQNPHGGYLGIVAAFIRSALFLATEAGDTRIAKVLDFALTLIGDRQAKEHR